MHKLSELFRLNHNLSGLNNSNHRIAFLEFQFVCTPASYSALDEVVSYANDHVGHYVTELDFLDFPAKFVSG